MKLEQLATISGFSISTLYDYLRSGLLQAPLRNGPTKSFFDEAHVLRLTKIRELKENEKMSLAEIREYFAMEEPSADKNENEEASVKNQITDKALELFSKFNYEDTKVSDITKALNMGSGTFYKYFKSKEELFLDCLERLPEILVPEEAWKEVKSETDCIQRLKKRGYAMLNAFDSYIAILNYVKLSIGSDNKHLAEKAAECIKKLVYPLKKDLTMAIADGSIRKVNEDLIAYLLLGINETFFHRMLIDSTYTIEEGFSIIEDFLAHALSPELSSSAPLQNDLIFNLFDLNHNHIAISNMKFNEMDFLAGNYYEGRMQVFTRDISVIEFKYQKKLLFADITGTSGNDISLAIDEDIDLSGVTDLGKFSIPVNKIDKLIRLAEIKKE